MSADLFDEFDKLSEEEQVIAQQFYEYGYADGYDTGVEAEDNSDAWVEEARKEGYQKGFEYEQQRIHSILEMQMKWAEQEGKGAEYLRWKNVKEYLTPIDLKPWTDEEWQEELAKDGF